MNYKKVRT